MREMLPEPVQRIDGSWRRAHVFRCSSCGKTHEVSISSSKGALPPQFLTKKMSKVGWVLGKRAGDDVCGDCAAKARSVPDMPVNPAAIMHEIKAEAPRVPSFDERRLIFAKLNDVYLDEKKGYSGAWSDKKVAEDLGVPWKWVEDIRSQNFGPVGDNETAREIVSEAKSLLDDIAHQRAEWARQEKALSDREAALRKKLGEVFKSMV